MNLFKLSQFFYYTTWPITKAKLEENRYTYTLNKTDHQFSSIKNFKSIH